MSCVCNIDGAGPETDKTVTGSKYTHICVAECRVLREKSGRSSDSTRRHSQSCADTRHRDTAADDTDMVEVSSPLSLSSMSVNVNHRSWSAFIVSFRIELWIPFVMSPTLLLYTPT